MIISIANIIGSISNLFSGFKPSFALDFSKISTDFTFTRSSFATRVNEFGLIETVTDLGSDLVQNGDFEELGSELVTNGDFSDGLIGWNDNATFPVESLNVVNDRLEFENISGTTQVFTSDTFSVTANKTYKISLDTIKESGADDFDITLRNIPLGTTIEVITTTHQTGELIYYFKSASTQSLVLQFTLRDTIKGSIDNVSVKQVDPNDEWILNPNSGTAIISGGKLNFNNCTSIGAQVQQSVSSYVVGKTYLITYTVSDFVQGEVRLSVGNQISTTSTSNGTFTQYITYTSGLARTYVYTNNSTLSIDNVSIQEVLEDDVPRIDYSDATFDVPVLGDELVVNGDFATDSSWTKLGGATIADGKANIIGDGSAFTSISQGWIFTSGKQYEVKVDVTINSGLGLKFQDGANNENIGFATTSGTYTFNFTGTSNSTLLIGRREGGTPFDSSVDNVSVKEVTAYTTTDKAAFLLEPQSTNLLPYSEDFSQWGVVGTLTSDAGISPDGTQNADLLDADGILGRLVYIITLNATTDYVVSMYVKANSVLTNYPKFRVYEIDSATMILSQNIKAQTVVGEWVRVEVPFTTTVGGNCQIRLMEDLELGESAYVWGAQLEALPYATSYIPTNGSTVTRSAETCVGATPTINSEEGVIYLETKPLSSTNRGIIALGNDSDVLKRIYIDFNNGVNDQLKVNLYDGISNQFQFITTLNNSSSNKIAVKYKTNDFALWVNGVEVATDNSGNTYSEGTLNELSFATTSNHAVNFYGNTKDLKIYDKALTDDELIELTTI